MRLTDAAMHWCEQAQPGAFKWALLTRWARRDKGQRGTRWHRFRLDSSTTAATTAAAATKLRGLARAARAPRGRPIQRRVPNSHCAARWQTLAAANRWAKLAPRLAEGALCRHRASGWQGLATSARTARAAPSSPQTPGSNTPAPRPSTPACTGLLAQSVLTSTRRSCWP